KVRMTSSWFMLRIIVRRKRTFKSYLDDLSHGLRSIEWRSSDSIRKENAMNTPTPIALVTGGSRGLGRDMALKLAAQGTDVIVTYRSGREEAAAVVAAIEADGRRAAALQLDVGDSARFDAFVTQVADTLRTHWQRGQFDALVNN